MPIPAKTTANGSPPAWACAAIWVASSRWGKPTDREDGELLAAHQRGERVDDRDAGEDRVARGVAGGRVERSTVHIGERVAEDRWAAVERRDPDRCTHVPATPRRRGCASGDPRNAQRSRSWRSPTVPSSTWITARSRSRSRTTPWRTPLPSRRISASSSHPTPSTPATTRRGPSTRRMSVYSIGAGLLMGWGAVRGLGRDARSRCRHRRDRRRRVLGSSGEKSTSSSSDAGSPWAISSRQRSWTSRTASAIAACLGGAA